VNSSLTVLDLEENIIGDRGAASLLKALTERNTTLTELCLSDNENISRSIGSAIEACVHANSEGIRLLGAGAKLDLSCKAIDCDSAKNIALNFEGIMPVTMRIVIGAARAKQVAIELADNTAVTTLAFNKREIGPQGCVDIADALNKNHVLTSIELNDNSIGDDGCTAMAVMLRENKVLTKVSLNGNGIGPTGAIALAETLRVNSSLRELGLGWNNVGNDGAMAIAEALRCNETLNRLNLEGNSIGDAGAMAILNALTESNCSLMWINLGDNTEISSGLQSAIDFVLASRRVLKSFCNFLVKPLDKKLMPRVIHAFQQSCFDREKLEPAHCQETGAGPIFLLVRSAALTDSKVIKVTAPS
jgi:NLR family CARD domain-containing protein 3